MTKFIYEGKQKECKDTGWFIFETLTPWQIERLLPYVVSIVEMDKEGIIACLVGVNYAQKHILEQIGQEEGLQFWV